MDGNIKLFNNDQDKVVLPSMNTIKEEDTTSLISESIHDAISGEKVKKLILPEDSVLADDNFVFDFSKKQEINIFQKEALKSLIDSTGNVALYLYRKSGIVKFGMGEKYSLERMIPLLRHFIFGDEIEVYKNYHIGEVPVPVTNRDITQMRLNL